MNTYAQFNTRVTKNDVESFEGRAWARVDRPSLFLLSHSPLAFPSFSILFHDR